MMRVLSKEEMEFKQKLKQKLENEIIGHVMNAVGNTSENAWVLSFVSDSRLIEDSINNLTSKAYSLLLTFKNKTAKVEKRGKE